MTRSVTRDIQAGTTAMQTIYLLPECRTRVTGQVVLHVAIPDEQILLGGLAPEKGFVVGRFSTSLR